MTGQSASEWIYIWIPHRPGSSHIKVPYPFKFQPRMIWSLVSETDPFVVQDVVPITSPGLSAYREFPNLDLTINTESCELIFHSRFSPGGHWMLLEI